MNIILAITVDDFLFLEITSDATVLLGVGPSNFSQNSYWYLKIYLTYIPKIHKLKNLIWKNRELCLKEKITYISSMNFAAIMTLVIRRR